MDRDRRANAAVLSLLILLGAGTAAAENFPGRPDAPAPPPKAEYKWDEPKDWKVPTLEELQALEWKDGRVATLRELEQERAKSVQPSISEAEALNLRNDSDEANAKILSALSRPPKNDEEVDWEATFNRRADGAPNSLNYTQYSSGVEGWICDLLYQGLFIFDHTMEPMADGAIVKTWRRNPMVDLLTLRDDLVWEDGTPWTAYDVEFTYHLILDQRINITAVRSGTDQLKWVKAFDAHTIAFFHPQPLVTNVWNVSFPVVPKHIYSPGLAADPTMVSSDWNVYWNQNPLASGPYRLKEHRIGDSLLMERRDSYYQDKSGKTIREKPYFKQVRYRIVPDENSALLAFKKGEIDEKRLVSQQWMRETDDAEFRQHGVKVNADEWGYSYIAWNQRAVPDVPYFKDKRVRQAMGLALNHKELREKLFYNLYKPGTATFHPASRWANPDLKPYEQDLDKAEELLDEAGWVDSDGDGTRDKTIDGKKWQFEFTMNVPQGGTGEKVAVLLKGDLETIGVKMNIKILEWATFSQGQDEHRFEALVASWGTGTDPDTSKNLWMTEEYKTGRNYVGYSNPEVDRLFEAGAKEFDPEKRKVIYQTIDKLLAEDQPYTFVLFRRSFWAFSKKVRGYNFSPRDPFSYSPGFLSIWMPKSPS